MVHDAVLLSHGSEGQGPLIAVVGETASGKSGLALELAKRFDGELICADSWTVYKRFDIGTAKPSTAERAAVPHHLLDVANPEAGFNAAEFQRLARLAMTGIRARGKLPILVGGTGLYIDSVLYNYQFLATPPLNIRNKLNNLTLQQLQQKVLDNRLDITDIDIRNKRRLIRLIENNGARPTKSSLRPNTFIIGIAVEREKLRERITQRVDTMLHAGLELEVRNLEACYGWGAEPMKGIGYREWREYFEGPGTDAQHTNRQTLEQTRERIIAATMGLAKRQRTWFKRNDRIHWLTSSNKMADAVDLVTAFLASNS
jgi:tRNA dimethylallyltransferase